MKLLRYGQPGSEQAGVLDAEGAIRDLSSIISDVAVQKRGQNICSQRLTPSVFQAPNSCQIRQKVVLHFLLDLVRVWSSSKVGLR